MKKIYLILMLVMSSYGYSYFQIGTQNCAKFLDEIEKDTIVGGYMLMYAAGMIDAKNFEFMFEKGFEPDEPLLRRSLVKYCEKNLSVRFYRAVNDLWLKNAIAR